MCVGELCKGKRVVILLSLHSSSERVSVERQIKEELRDIMRTEDLENITSKQVPQRRTRNVMLYIGTSPKVCKKTNTCQGHRQTMADIAV